MNANNEFIFQRVSALAQDSGPIGVALRELKGWEWLLPEADRWQEPWKFLLNCRDIPKPVQKVLIAAQSQRAAARRLAEIAGGFGTIETSWPARAAEAMKTGNNADRDHAAKKILKAMVEFDHGKLLLEGTRNLSAAQATEVERRIREVYRQRRRKYGQKKADTPRKPIFNVETISGKFAWLMISGWLRNGVGGAGYCFFGDAALLSFFSAALRLPKPDPNSDRFEEFRRLRQSLLLKKATILIERVEASTGVLRLLNRKGELIQSYRP